MRKDDKELGLFSGLRFNRIYLPSSKTSSRVIQTNQLAYSVLKRPSVLKERGQSDGGRGQQTNNNKKINRIIG